MAQLKDLIVNGPSRFIGNIYATTFTGDLNGNANTATSATTAAALTGKTLVTASAVTTSNWPTYGNNHIPTMSFMTYWNGAYSGTSSNLTYCAQGAIIGSNNIGNQSVKYATTSGSCNGNAATATKWATSRIITLTGSVTGSVSIDGSANVSLATTTNHTHTFASLTSKPTTLSGYGITDAPTKSGAGATGTWGISISGNAATATTATTAITATKIGTSTVGSTTMPVYINSGTPTAITSFPEAYLSWGGTNIQGDVSPIDAAFCSEIGNNKLAFLPADCITIEYTTDGGSTWIDYGASDAQKTSLVTYYSGNPFYIGHGLASATDGTMTNSNCSNYQVRITISTRNSSGTAKLYTVAKKLLINFSSNGAEGSKVKLETQTIGNYNNNVDTWSTIGTYNVAGWSGWNSIPLLLLFGGYVNQLNQPAKLRLTLSITTVNTNYSCKACILDLRLIGITNNVSPSIMSRTGHLYDFDANQNATFPAAITSAKFVKSGGTSSQFLKADGSVDSNTYSKTSHTHTSVLDVGSSSTITFAYSKAGLSYGDYTYLAGWYGSELRAINKSQFAQASHTHTKSQITDFPSSLPASDVKAWAKADTKPSYTGTEVTLTNYSNPNSYTPIASGDSVQVAIAKLEGAISGLEDLLASI